MENIELNEIKEKAIELEGENQKFMDPGSQVKPKKGRGRPKKEKSEKKENPEKAPTQDTEPIPDIPTKVIIAQALPLVSNAMVKFAGHEAARMQPDEMDSMASILAALMDKYAPSALSKYGLEITALVICGQYGFRVYQVKSAVDAERERQKYAFKPPQTEQPDPTPVMPKMRIVENPIDQPEQAPEPFN